MRYITQDAITCITMSIEKLGDVPEFEVLESAYNVTILDLCDAQEPPRQRLAKLACACISVGVDGVVILEHNGSGVHNFLNSRGIFGHPPSVQLPPDLDMPEFDLVSSGYVDHTIYRDVIVVTQL